MATLDADDVAQLAIELGLVGSTQVGECREAAQGKTAQDLLRVLERKGYLTEGEDGLPPGEPALWALQDIDPRTAVRRLAEMMGVDRAELEGIVPHLGRHEFVMFDRHRRDDLVVSKVTA